MAGIDTGINTQIPQQTELPQEAAQDLTRSQLFGDEGFTHAKLNLPRGTCPLKQQICSAWMDDRCHFDDGCMFEGGN